MTPIIRFIGRSGSGKTTLLADVVRRLDEQGVRVAAFKHAHHRVDLDRKGKDSFRFAEAGARFVTVVAPDKVARFEVTQKRHGLLDLARGVGNDIDVILAEGFHGVATPYFLVYTPGADGERKPECEPGDRLGVIARGASGDGVRLFDRNDTASIAARIVEWLRAVRDADDVLERALAEAQAFHGHMCPGQVLGVRLALLGCRAAGVEHPQTSKQLITWVEIDRCGADAVQTVTGCRPGKRTLKLVDYGKLAATFLNTESGRAVRVSARTDSRERAAALYPQLERHEAQLAAYRVMADEELFDVQEVAVDVDVYDRPGKPGMRVVCTACGEDVNDNRQVETDGGPLCRGCAHGAYYRPAIGAVSEAASW